MRKNFIYALIVTALFCLIADLSRAGVIYDISMNTAPLVGHAASPFSIEFQFNDGSGTGDGNNTAVVSNFNFGTGGALGAPSLIGGASGSASTSITVRDSAFLNRFVQQFMPGSALGFRLTLDKNVDAGGTPDEFTFAILDRTGVELPTKSPFDVLVLIDIDSPNPTVRTFGTDAARLPAGGGAAIVIAAPTASSVPEPASWSLLVAGLGAAAYVRRRKWQSNTRFNAE